MSIERLTFNQNVREDLDEKNFRNLINFYEPELRSIMNGVSPLEVLGYTTRRKFRRLRVFRDRRGSNHLSEKTLLILNSARDEI
jgi:hypothetical protein